MHGLDVEPNNRYNELELVVDEQEQAAESETNS